MKVTHRGVEVDAADIVGTLDGLFTVAGAMTRHGNRAGSRRHLLSAYDHYDYGFPQGLVAEFLLLSLIDSVGRYHPVYQAAQAAWGGAVATGNRDWVAVTP